MKPAFSLSIYAIAYGLFFLLLRYCKREKASRLLDKYGWVQKPFLLLFCQLAGILLFGIICPYFSDHDMAGIVFGKITNVCHRIAITIFFAVIIIIGIPALVSYIVRLQVASKAIPFFNFKRFLTGYFFIRILFIVAYEICIRGYLLKDCIQVFDKTAAISLNILLYALLHTVNSKKEWLACIPFGWLLCILCVKAAAAWPAILIHIAVALWYDIALARKIYKPTIYWL